MGITYNVHQIAADAVYKVMEKEKEGEIYPLVRLDQDLVPGTALKKSAVCALDIALRTTVLIINCGAFLYCTIFPIPASMVKTLSPTYSLRTTLPSATPCP